MDDLLSEKEQIEAIRSWWSENGRYVISGLVIGVGLLFGWNYWNRQQREAHLEASALYETLVGAVADTEVASAEETAGQMYADYGSTPYAGQTRLAMARLYMDVGRDEDAAGALRQLLEVGGDGEVALLARLRLAKILLYQEKPQEVVDLLEGHGDTAFAARYGETLGDAYVALGRTEDAAAAYQTALADNPNTPTVDRTLIQMKIYDLPEVPESAAAQADAADGEGVAGDDVVPDSLPVESSGPAAPESAPERDGEGGGADSEPEPGERE